MRINIIEIQKTEQETFDTFEKFLDKLNMVATDTSWQECTADSILFAENPEGVPFEGFGGDEFECINLSLNHGWTFVPLRYTSLQSILSRAECYGNGIKRLFLANKSKFAEHLNDYFHLLTDGRKSKMLALIQEGKVSAIHSGSYKPIPMPEIFKILEDYIHDFDNATFLYGEWSWESAQARYKIVDKQLEDVYTNLLKKYFNFKQVDIELMAISSDVAEAAVRFYPRFVLNNSTLVPLSCGASVKHIGAVDLETVESRLGDVFTSFEAACRNLAALADVRINHKKNTMMKAYAKLNIPQKYAADICEKYQNIPTSALDVYTSMCEVLNAMKGNVSDSSILNYEDALTKLITYNRASWNRLDVSGVVTWQASK